MKILHIISTFPPRIGGMGVVCSEEAVRLSKNNAITVLTISYSQNESESDKYLPFTVKRIKPIVKIGDAGWFAGGLKKHIKNCDVAHLHYPFYGAIGSIIKLKKLFGFPLLVTYHMDPQGRGVKKILQKLYDKIYAKKLFKIADKVIAVDLDHYLNTKYGRVIGKEKILLLNNGVDTNIFSPSGLSEWPLSNELKNKLSKSKNLLFVGNFLSVKNIKVIFEALKILDKNIKLAVIGGGYDENKLKKYVKDNDQIEFLGNQFSRTQLAQCYRSADIVVVPSLSESFSLVALEAMSSGSVVATSDLPGIKNRIMDGKNGFIVKNNTANGWAECVNEILKIESEKLIEIKKRARESCIKYDWSNHANILSNIYRTLV